MSYHFVNYDRVALTYNRRFADQKHRPIAAALINMLVARKLDK